MVGGKIVLEGAERQELERRMRASRIAVRDRQRRSFCWVPMV